MPAAIIATQLQTPDTTRAYTINVGPGADITSSVAIDSLEFEDQGTSAQGTTSFRINGKLVNFPQVADQALVSIYDHVSGSQAYRGFIDSRHPARQPLWDQIEVTSSDHTSLLDNVIPFENRPAGEGDAARIGYLWGKYAGSYLQGSMAFVTSVNTNLPAQIFASVSLRQALDLIAAQASTSAVWYLDSTGRLHYFTSETNNAPYNVTSDTAGGGEIAPLDLEIDYDSKNYASAVYVRGKTDAGSGWVYSAAAGLAHNGLQRTTFLDAPDCTTATMRNALGNMYLGRLGNAVNRGSFSTISPNDGWRAGQNVTVRSTHLGNINQAFRIARVRTKVLGLASKRNYDIEFGGARAGTSGGSGSPVVGTALVGDILDDNGNLLLGSGSDAATSGLGPAMRRYITSGVYNGDFALTPPLADAQIVNSYNPLPYWSIVNGSGTAHTPTSIVSSASGSGRAIQIDMAAGAAGDFIYLEQTVPVNGSAGQSFDYIAALTLTTGPTVSNAGVRVNLSHQDANGIGVGVNHSKTVLTTTMGANTTYEIRSADPQVDLTAGTPARAAIVVIQILYLRNTAADATTETIYLNEVRLLTGPTQLLIRENTQPTVYNAGKITYDNGILSLAADVGINIVPAGTIFAYGAAAAPAGFLLCDGTSVLRATYPNLFAAIGTTYGTVDGTHFNVPNLVDKLVIGGTPGVGAGTASPAAALTQHGVHTHTGPSHTHPLSAAGAALIDVGSVIMAKIHAVSTWTSTVLRTPAPAAGANTTDSGGADLTGATDAGGTGVTGNESAGLTHAIFKNALVSYIIKI